jgi:hypothetical protein
MPIQIIGKVLYIDFNSNKQSLNQRGFVSLMVMEIELSM